MEFSQSESAVSFLSCPLGISPTSLAKLFPRFLYDTSSRQSQTISDGSEQPDRPLANSRSYSVSVTYHSPTNSRYRSQAARSSPTRSLNCARSSSGPLATIHGCRRGEPPCDGIAINAGRSPARQLRRLFSSTLLEYIPDGLANGSIDACTGASACCDRVPAFSPNSCLDISHSCRCLAVAISVTLHFSGVIWAVGDEEPLQRSWTHW